MAYGIDDTIQQKVDAYRGNPGALQQRYAQNKELIDLLALQKLKSEKDAAARDMQMKMQQKPQTIAQQYEAELAGRTKNEMLQGIAGVMQNRQAKQQANMQRMAQGTPPTAPKRMMAQGGIIGFADGNTPQSKLDKIEEIRKKIAARVAAGELTEEEGRKEANKQIEVIAPAKTPDFSRDPEGALRKDSGLLGKGLNLLGVPTSEVADLEAAQRQETGAKLNYEADMRDMPYREAAAAAGAPKGGRLAGTATNAIADLDPSIGQYKNAGQNQILGATTNVSPPPAATAPEEKPPVVTKDPPPAKPPVPQLKKGLGQVDEPDKRTKFLDPNALNVGLENAKTTKPLLTGIDALMTQDPTKAAGAFRDAVEKYGTSFLGMSPERIAAEKARQGALAALDARQQDPKKLKSDQFSAFLRGISKSGNFAGGGAGLANLKAQQELAERNRLLQRQGVERDFEGKQQDIKEKVFTSAMDASSRAYDAANQNIRAGTTALSQLNTAEINMLNKNADRILSANVANMEAEDRDTRLRVEAAMGNASQEVKVAVANLEAKTADRRLDIESQLDMLKIEQLDRARAEQTLGNVEKYMSDIRTEYEKIYQDRLTALSGISGQEPDPAKVKALREEMNAAIVISVKGLRDKANAIQDRLKAQYGDPSSGLSYEGTE